MHLIWTNKEKHRIGFSLRNTEHHKKAFIQQIYTYPDLSQPVCDASCLASQIQPQIRHEAPRFGLHILLCGARVTQFLPQIPCVLPISSQILTWVASRNRSNLQAVLIDLPVQPRFQRFTINIVLLYGFYEFKNWTGVRILVNLVRPSGLIRVSKLCLR